MTRAGEAGTGLTATNAPHITRWSENNTDALVRDLLRMHAAQTKSQSAPFTTTTDGDAVLGSAFDTLSMSAMPTGDLGLAAAEAGRGQRAFENLANQPKRRTRFVGLSVLDEQGAGLDSTDMNGKWADHPAARNGSGNSANNAPVNYRGEEVEAAQTPYFEDFEEQNNRGEWSSLPIADFEELGRFAGPMRITTRTLNVRVEAGELYELSFDLCVVSDTRDRPDASDLFGVLIDDVQIMGDRFNAIQQRNAESHGDEPDFNPAIVPEVRMIFIATAPIAEISFQVSGAGAPGGEAWGLDNVSIERTPEATLGQVAGDAGGGGALWSIGGARIGSGQSFAQAPQNIRSGGGFSGSGGGGGGGGGDTPNFFPPQDPTDETPPDDTPPPPEDDPTPPEDTPDVPVPGTLGLFAIAGLMGGRRSRR